MSYSKFITYPIFKILVYANVFISVCAFAQVFVTYEVFNITFNYKNYSYLLFVMLSTYLQYNIQRGYMINANNKFTERSIWLMKHKKIIFYSIGVSLITVLFLCNNLSWLSVGIMVGAEIISTLYYLPPFNFRKFGYLKPLLVAAVWVISCSLVPLIENKLLTLHAICFLSSQFFLIATLCVLFDIKDAEEDYMNGVNTYPNKFGILFTKIFAVALVLIAIGCSYLFDNTLAPYLINTIVLSLVILLIIVFINHKQHSLYYYLLVDGVLLLQGILFLISRLV